MKANEFFKAYGFDEVKYLVSLAGNARVCCIDGEHIHVDDLKRLVESHELVESYGGLNESKRIFEMRHGVINFDGWDKLKQAIADVESCQ